MRVLIVTQYFWPEEFYLNDVVASFFAKGIEVNVLTGKPNYPEGKVFNGYSAWGCQTETWRGIYIMRVPIFPRGNKSAWRLALNYVSFVISAIWFGLWLLRNRKYDVILAYGVSPILQTIPAIFLGRIKSCKVATWVQDLWPESLMATGYIVDQRILNFIKNLIKLIYSHTDLLLVQSKAFIDPIKLLAPTIEIKYQPNSVHPIFYSHQTEIVELPNIEALDSGFSVVFAGNIGEAQGVDLIVEAATRLIDHPKIRFVVIGQGSRWEWMNQQKEARGLRNLYLPGRFPMNTMPGLLKKASVLLVTLTDQPIFEMTVPNKIQAYLAVGRPILACLNGEGAKLVDESGAGISVPAENVDMLVNAVINLYVRLPEELDLMGANGRAYFLEHFDHGKLVQIMLNYLEELIRKGNR